VELFHPSQLIYFRVAPEYWLAPPVRSHEGKRKRPSKELNMKFRIASLLILAAAATSAANAADAPSPNLNVVGAVSINAMPGDSIFAAKSHRHEYVYVAHVNDKTVDVIDVSNPANPRQLSGKDATRALQAKKTAGITVSDSPSPSTARVLDISTWNEARVLAEFPNAISTTNDNRKLIYVLDGNSLRIFSTTKPAEDDSWFKNAMSPG
jgi:hypothetical protein